MKTEKMVVIGLARLIMDIQMLNIYNVVTRHCI